ncbi:unnamed protein product [Heligmosomoides polygyrus]|uniref:Uncharacterized protein n=1 Tax=Heligmosomoides polygyrus TaxID=6339 RepID=A0A183FVS9_HELPZ|nr:unnamed protein product [Heligmosomoides polygyrus]
MIVTASVTLLFLFVCNAYSSSMLKREVDLLDMLRTPLMLSFNRNNAFVTNDRQNDYMTRLLRMQGAQRLSQPTTSE